MAKIKNSNVSKKILENSSGGKVIRFNILPEKAILTIKFDSSTYVGLIKKNRFLQAITKIGEIRNNTGDIFQFVILGSDSEKKIAKVLKDFCA